MRVAGSATLDVLSRARAGLRRGAGAEGANRPLLPETPLSRQSSYPRLARGSWVSGQPQEGPAPDADNGSGSAVPEAQPQPGEPGAHKVYPYLLRGLVSDRPNLVWATDITYIPMARGFVYLVAIMDRYSRKVLSWRVSNTLDTSLCVDALEEAVEACGVPELFNTDQGSQFTSEELTGVLKRHDICISMDGKGRWVDNVFVERLWRSVKYEEVYLKACAAWLLPRRHWAGISPSTVPGDGTSRLTGAHRTAFTTNLLPGWRLDPRRHLSCCPVFGGVRF